MSKEDRLFQKPAGRNRGTRYHFPFPPPDFDPLREDPKQYGLPPLPNKDTQPELHAAWLRLFEPPHVFVPPAILETELLIRQPNIRQILPYTSRIENSANWCGASIVPHDGDQFVMLFGEWTVPVPSLPPPSDQGPKGQKTRYCCVAWIGIDGNRRYLDSTLPQIGTEQVLTVDSSGQPSVACTAWFQWWGRTQVKLTRFYLTNITVDAGISVMALIWVINPRHVVAVFRTFAPLNQITVLVEPMPEVYLRPHQPAKVQPLISGATAEWIVERPEQPVLTGAALEPFPNYGPVQFLHCVAGTAQTAGMPTSEETLRGPRLFRMFEVPKNHPPRIRLISMPEWTSTTSVRVHYGGFPG